jgi:hypothetical protein
MADYSFGGRDFINLIEPDLKSARLFVQLLGRQEIYSPIVPQGYNRLQFEVAKANNIPVMQWLQPSLTNNESVDPDHLALLSGHDVMRVPFEELQREIVQILGSLETSVKIPEFVRIVSDKSDSILARVLSAGTAEELCRRNSPL